MFRKLTRQINSISMAALLISFFSLFSKILGILRDHLLARYFGASRDLDIYYAAFRLPDFIMNLLILGVVSAGLIPIMSRILHKDKDGQKKFWKLLNNLINLYLLTFTIITVLFFIFIYPIMSFLTPGFNAEDLDKVVYLTRIMFLSPLFLGLSSLFSSGIQIFKQYILYSLAPVAYNLGIILGIVIFSKYWGIEGVVYGVILGAFSHLLVQWYGMAHLGFKFKFILDWKDRYLRQLLKLALPRFFTLSLFQVNIIIITMIATLLPEGSLSIFNFANNLQSLPLSLFGVPFAIASFPMLATYFHKNDLDEYKTLFYKTLKQILFFVIPAMFLFILLRAQIVRLVLGSGKFDWNDTILTMETLALFILSLIAQSVFPLLTRAFYAIENTVIPFFVVLFSTILNAVLAYKLIHFPVPEIFHNYLNNKELGVLGLALAFSISAIAQSILLALILKKKVLRKFDKTLLPFIAKNLLASVLMGIAVQISKNLVGNYLDLSHYWQVLLQFSIALLAGFIVYYITMKILKVPEFIYWESKILSKLKFLKYEKNR